MDEDAVSGVWQQLTYPLPGGSRHVGIQGDFPLSESEWTYFLNLLNVMKAGLVVPDEIEPDPLDSTDSAGNSG